ncbi:MAG: FAD-binding oxidoreductase [Thermodesulfobacteriota bacterium]
MSEYPEYDPGSIYEDLRKVLPEEVLSRSLFERINNALDPYTFASDISQEEVPYLVVRPRSTVEVSELMKYAHSNRIPVFVRGSGTSLQGASRYFHKGIVLNVSKLNHLDIMKDYGFVEFGPGHRVLHVKEQLEKEGYFLPLVPGSIRVASIGGIISNNTTAHAVDSCMGKPRDYILGLEAVLPTGEVLQTGTKSLRRAAGTDLTHYFVGGDGLLGIITSIRMRLLPGFKNAYGVAFSDDPIPLARAVQRVYLEKAPPPLFLEFLDKRVAQISFEIQGLPSPPGPLIMFHAIGQTEEEATFKINQLVKVINKESPIEAKRIDDLDEWRKIWLARESALPFICQAGKGVFGLSEIVSTVPSLVDCLKDAMNMSKGMPTLEKIGKPYLFGHIGALTFHPVFIIPVDWPPEEKGKVLDEMFLREAEINTKYGTCGGEWGQFARRTPFYIKRYGEKAFQLVREVKKVFDPNNILNPDVLR